MHVISESVRVRAPRGVVLQTDAGNDAAGFHQSARLRAGRAPARGIDVELEVDQGLPLLLRRRAHPRVGELDFVFDFLRQAVRGVGRVRVFSSPPASISASMEATIWSVSSSTVAGVLAAFLRYVSVITIGPCGYLLYITLGSQSAICGNAMMRTRPSTCMPMNWIIPE